MSGIFEQFYTDTIKIISKNGSYTSQLLKAKVSPNKITTYEINIAVEDGDFIERILSNGKIETYVIIEAFFKEKFQVFEAHYDFNVRKATALPKVIEQTIYNLSGNNSRVYNQSTDNSTNTVGTNAETLFSELRQIIQSQINPNSQLLSLVNEMEQNKGRKTFLDKYTAFIAAAANHISILSPFIPGLTALIAA